VSQLITTAGTGTLNINDERFSLKQDGEYLGSFLFPLHHPDVGSGVRLLLKILIGHSKPQINLLIVSMSCYLRWGSHDSFKWET
jgi:hypothetical protein